MTEASLKQHICDRFPGVETSTNLSYTFFFYGSERKLPFATLVSADNDYDRVSNVDRPGVFRLNIGVSKGTFHSLFGAAKIDPSRYDFTAFDSIMPHPHYAAQHFVCVLNPADATSAQVEDLLTEAYQLAASRRRSG